MPTAALFVLVFARVFARLLLAQLQDAAVYMQHNDSYVSMLVDTAGLLPCSSTAAGPSPLLLRPPEFSFMELLKHSGYKNNREADRGRTGVYKKN